MTMVDTFETKKINIETLPEYLKDTRESFSYTLNHVSHITNISEKFLAALEAGQYHKLPADVYIYGFLRSLAELYRTDSQALIDQFKKERGIRDNVTRAQGGKVGNASGAQVYTTYSPSKFAVTPRTITVGAVVLLALFVLGYLFYQVHAINQPPSISVTQPKDGDVIHSSSVVVQGRTDAGAELTINDQPVTVDSSGSFSQSVSLTSGQKELSFVAKNSFGKTSTKQVTVIADFQNPDTGTQPTGLNLTVTTSAPDVTITIQADGNQAVSEVFSTASSKAFTAQQQVTVGTTDAGNTDVQLNGKDLGKLGRVGQSLQGVAFTQSNLSGAGN